MAVRHKKKFVPRSHIRKPHKPKAGKSIPSKSLHKLRPPPGYTFVKKGDVFITRRCTTLTHEAGQVVHVVYVGLFLILSIIILTSVQQENSKKRIGLFVPHTVYKSVRKEALLTVDKREAAVRRKDERDIINAREALSVRYPAMPSPDREKILGHAFMKGSGRVGRTGKESMERRTSLAVEAHVRHTHTEYDELLRKLGLSREEARKVIRGKVKTVKKKWRGLKGR
ncbi:hypothetical protein M501DRAFT_1000512 [Patellaria atrata CBS 101060]|uniref:DUF2293 domain-containing protein n=1 Tax=Patellaria atrata CBS 101060 TaxID=1346257 RepID=A0A9P4SGG3_9PEZI|nr:hypothetical protein M501DRAFT_1000512 [Patellaria atrata CBS 101060]